MEISRIFSYCIDGMNFDIITQQDLNDLKLVRVVIHFPCIPLISLEVKHSDELIEMILFGDVIEIREDRFVEIKKALDGFGWNRYESIFPITFSRDTIVKCLVLVLSGGK